MNNHSGLILESQKLLLDPAPNFTRSEGTLGGAIFIRGLRCVVDEDQFQGARFVGLTEATWGGNESCLLENERLFEVKVEELSTVDGNRLSPSQVCRKVVV